MDINITPKSTRNRKVSFQKEEKPLSAERKEIQELARKQGSSLFSTRGINWYQLGLYNYIRSWLSRDYENVVKEEFKAELTQKIQDRATEIRKTPNKEEQKRCWKELITEVSSLSLGDLTLNETLGLLTDLPEYEKSYKKKYTHKSQKCFFGYVCLSKY